MELYELPSDDGYINVAFVDDATHLSFCGLSELPGCTRPIGGASGSFSRVNIYLKSSVLLPLFPSEFAAPTSGDSPLGWVAFHEFGHALGFKHSDSDPGIMNTGWGRGGDPLGKYRVNALESVSLETYCTQPIVGALPNIILYGFSRIEEHEPDVQEIWQDELFLTGTGSPGGPPSEIRSWARKGECHTAGTYPTCCIHDFVDPPYVIMNNQPTPASVEVGFFLTATEPTAFSHCVSGHKIGSTTKNLQTGDAKKYGYAFNTFVNGISPGIPAGDYFLCAAADPDSTIAESSEDDNWFVADEGDFGIGVCEGICELYPEIFPCFHP